MGAKTAKEIQGDFLAMLQVSPLAEAISGSVYRAGLRPRDSRNEDITVALVSGLADQIQRGVVAICVYVPDSDPYNNGVLVEDMKRTADLERIAQDWVDTFPERGTDYVLQLQDTITTVAEESIHQHFVSIMLHYRLFTEY
ncbi:MAG: hypothetical protein IJV22_06125 [Bacteroidales bacterium]|nr:hypothetical protein [Bacteroidales bacterium]